MLDRPAPSQVQRGNRWHPPAQATLEKIRALYAAGWSTREVAGLTGYSHPYISKLCRDIARSKGAAAQLKRKLSTSKHWRSCRRNARLIVEERLGRKLVRNEHVHHRDHDYTNNAPSNLTILSASEHAQHHHPKCPPRQGSCVICARAFPRPRSRKHTCSRRCAGILNWRTRRVR